MWILSWSLGKSIWMEEFGIDWESIHNASSASDSSQRCSTIPVVDCSKTIFSCSHDPWSFPGLILGRFWPHWTYIFYRLGPLSSSVLLPRLKLLKRHCFFSNIMENILSAIDFRVVFLNLTFFMFPFLNVSYFEQTFDWTLSSPLSGQLFFLRIFLWDGYW